jgi:hypothetical protein
MSDGLLGNMLVKIIGDKTSLDAALDAAEKNTKSTESRINAHVAKIGDSFAKTGKALSIGLTAPIVAAGTAAIKFASDTRESMNAATVVFKESSGIITGWSKNAAEQIGMTSAEFYQATAVMGAGLINAGASTDQAAKQTIELTKRAADMASIFNTSVSDALSALQSGLRGESEPLKRFAISLDEASIKAKAVALGLADSESSVSAYAKSQARLAIIMEQSSRFQGDFINTSDEMANSSRIVTAQLKEQASKFGELLLPVVKNVVNGIRGFTDSLAKLDEGQRTGVVTFAAFAAAAGPVALGISAIMKAITATNPVVFAITLAFAGMVTAISSIAGAAARAKKETEDLSASMAQQAGVETMQKALDLTNQKIQKLQDQIKKAEGQLDEWDIAPLRESIKELEAQKGIIESNIATLNRQKTAQKEEVVLTQEVTDTIKIQIAARKSAAEEYENAIALAKSYVKEGLYTEEQAVEATTAATRAYAEALITAGYSSAEASIGGRALKQALGEVDLVAKQAAAAIRDIPALSPLDPEAVESIQSYDEFLVEFRARRAKEEADESAALAKKKAEQTAYLDIIKNGLNETNGAFVALGEAFVTGENPAKAFFKTLIGTIGDAVIAFAALTEAQGWATWPLVDWAKVIKGAALAVLGGTVKAAAASLASGGVASGPTLAVVGDNPYADEMVAPLTPDTFRGFADGLLNALAERSRPAGITEATVASATVSGSSGAGSTINLHVGTLIADDAGMRKLNRELRKFGLQENVRTGYGG